MSRRRIESTTAQARDFSLRSVTCAPLSVASNAKASNAAPLTFHFSDVQTSSVRKNITPTSSALVEKLPVNFVNRVSAEARVDEVTRLTSQLGVFKAKLQAMADHNSALETRIARSNTTITRERHRERRTWQLRVAELEKNCTVLYESTETLQAELAAARAAALSCGPPTPAETGSAVDVCNQTSTAEENDSRVAEADAKAAEAMCEVASLHAKVAQLDLKLASTSREVVDARHAQALAEVNVATEASVVEALRHDLIKVKESADGLATQNEHLKSSLEAHVSHTAVLGAAAPQRPNKCPRRKALVAIELATGVRPKRAAHAVRHDFMSLESRGGLQLDTMAEAVVQDLRSAFKHRIEAASSMACRKPV